MRSLIIMLWHLTGIPARLAARREAAAAEAHRAEVLRQRLAVELTALGEGPALMRISLAYPRTVAAVRALATPWRYVLSPELRRALWPEDPS